MKKFLYGRLSFVFSVAVLFSLCFSFNLEAQTIKAPSQGRHKVNTLVILYTGDLHSCADKYPQLAAFVKQEREKQQKAGCAVITVDAGDIAMGTVYSAVSEIEATEYRALAMMGYDAYVFGNHDFDLGLDAAAFSFYNSRINGRGEDPVTGKDLVFPVNVTANIDKYKNENFRNALHFIGNKPYIIIERAGVKIGIFGIFGKGALSVSNVKDEMTIKDPVETAKQIVAELKKQKVDFIVALSHSGSLLRAKSEDGILAKKCPGIDVIISGHDHEAIFKPWKVGNTLICAAGSSGDLLGEVELRKGAVNNPQGFDLKLVPNNIVPDRAGQILLDSVSNQVTRRFNKEYMISPFDVIANNKVLLNSSPDKNGAYPLAKAIAKSFFEAMYKIGNLPVSDTSLLIGATPAGVIRHDLPAGDVTYKNIINILSLGRDSRGNIGYPLVTAWVTGKELKDLCEVNVSIAPKMPDAFITFYGLEYEYNSSRMRFTKVRKVFVHGKPVVDDKLYQIVTGYYSALCISMLKSKSHGLISIVPKYKNGKAVKDLKSITVKRSIPGGKSVLTRDINEWYAFAEYLRDNGGISADFKAVPDGTDNKKDSVQILYSAIELFIIAFLIWIIRRIFKRRKK